MSSDVLSDRDSSLRHEALLHSGEDEFLAGTLPFVREAVAGDEPVLIAVGESKLRLLEAHLGHGAHGIRRADIRQVARNPARIIPLWGEFVADHSVAGRPVRGIAEPVWPGRSEAELVECRHTESLLNVAFADAPSWRLLCCYDADALDPEVLEAAQRTHPVIAEDGINRQSDAYLPPPEAPGPFDGPLPEPSPVPDELAFGPGDLGEVRGLAYRQAMNAALEAARTSSLVLAVNELATNSVRHAGGRGTLRVWREPDALVCEVRDHGHFDSPLVGRERPEPLLLEGRGLWLVNQVCDLVQIRSSADGTVVRVRMDLG